MFKKSILYSILFLKCAQCRQGEFLQASPHDFSSMNKVKQRCPNCDLKYSIEPSFYTGSMYVSYGVGIAFAVAAFVILWIVGFATSPLTIFVVIVLTLALTFPYIGAVSKSIWAHLFFKYNPALGNKQNDDSRN